MINHTFIDRKRALIAQIETRETHMPDNTMTAHRAAQLLGNQPMWAIKNMAKALSLFPLMNTPEEDERLAAAQWAIANQRAFSIEASKRRR